MPNTLLEKNGDIVPERRGYAKAKVVDVTGDGSKVQSCKEQHCKGTWNVRSMNQGKLEIVKQVMARVNIDILGISELKWTGMGKFNSDDYFIYYIALNIQKTKIMASGPITSWEIDGDGLI